MFSRLASASKDQDVTVEVVNDVEDYINLEAVQIVEDTIHDIESEFDIVSE